MYFFANAKSIGSLLAKITFCKNLSKAGVPYIYEEVSFGASQETMYYTYQLVYELTKRKGLLESKYDLYDFSYNIFCYEETTLRIFRYDTYIYLIRSTEPMSIEEFESITPYVK